MTICLHYGWVIHTIRPLAERLTLNSSQDAYLPTTAPTYYLECEEKSGIPYDLVRPLHWITRRPCACGTPLSRYSTAETQ